MMRLVFALILPVAWAFDNGVARTPPMGWNSWNHYHGAVSAKVLRATADIFKAKGYADAGYVFVNTDDVRMTHIALPIYLVHPHYHA